MRPVVLVGLPGAGKTKVGEALARQLGREFVDTDQEIERRSELTVAEFFARHGEKAFRTLERQVVAELIQNETGVIAFGGGTFQDPSTRALALKRCTTVWLDLPTRILVQRIQSSPPRPLFAGRNPHLMLWRLRLARSAALAKARIRVSQPTVAGAVAAIELALIGGKAEAAR